VFLFGVLVQDAHVEMMEKSYAKVPYSWYITIGTSMTLAAIYVVVAYPLQVSNQKVYLNQLHKRLNRLK
jgi:hypothetical protein